MKIVLILLGKYTDRLTMSFAVTQHWEKSIQKFLRVEEVLVCKSVFNPGLDVRTIQTTLSAGIQWHKPYIPFKGTYHLRFQCKHHSKFH